MGRNGGHQRGVSMAAYGELSMATVKSSLPTHIHPVVEDPVARA